MGTVNLNSGSQEALVYTAKDMLTHRWSKGRSPGIRPPEAAILCYQPSLMAYAASEYPVRKVKGFFGDVYQLKPSDGKVVIAGNFGVGAPVATMLLEELAAFGVRQFISIGLAGSLQPHLLPGSIVICEGAQRDEGTSAHYSPAGEVAQADVGIVQRLSKVMEELGIKAEIGSSWTTDAPYRETWKEVDFYRQKGLLTVEMEAAAIFTAGKALGVQVGAVLVVADPILRRGWNTTEEEVLLQQRLQKLLNAIVSMMFQAGLK